MFRKSQRFDLCVLVDHLTAEQLGLFERQARVRRFRRGELIYTTADSAETLLFVASGVVALKDFTADGKETILMFVRDGELFGEQALYDESQRGEYAEAVEDSRILAVRREEFLSLMG